ncbi:hypothetical protein [Terrarubrum flagellatum]|uniref:hypothetical protein n=1 Tax=Terrirubrum flagellatum TaxID=2895980 RepID=UPI003144EA3C
MRTMMFSAAFAIMSLGAAQAQSIGGRYDVVGANLDGSAYRGTAQITATSQNTCRIVWNTGGVSEGICMRNNNAFTAAYSLRGKIGLVIYQVMNDGSMQGLWTLADTQGVGRETLVPVR